MKLLRIKYKRNYTSDEWPNEYFTNASINKTVTHRRKNRFAGQSVQANFEQLAYDSLVKSESGYHPSANHPVLQFQTKYHTIEDDPQYSYQYFWFANLPDPVPEMLGDWFSVESRRLISHYWGDATGGDDTPYNLYASACAKYKNELGIRVVNIDVVDSNNVSVWPG